MFGGCPEFLPVVKGKVAKCIFFVRFSLTYFNGLQLIDITKPHSFLFYHFAIFPFVDAVISILEVLNEGTPCRFQGPCQPKILGSFS